MTVVSGAPVPMDVLADPAAAVDSWSRWLHRTGLADNTKLAYDREARAFVRWVLAQDKHRPDEVFCDPYARDFSVKDYRRWLLTDGGGHPRAPKSVDLALTSLGSLYGWIGLGRPTVAAAASKTKTAPKALTEPQIHEVLRAARRRGPRDHALTVVFLSTGLRVSELAALNVDDAWVTARQGAVQVRAGKGDRPRTVPLNAWARESLAGWLRLRGQAAKPTQQALFTTRTGNRMAIRTVRHTIEQVGHQSGVLLHPHLLRHTFATIMVRAGVDIVTVAELLGHASLETARIYSRPTSTDLTAAVDHVNFEQ